MGARLWRSRWCGHGTRPPPRLYRAPAGPFIEFLPIPDLPEILYPGQPIEWKAEPLTAAMCEVAIRRMREAPPLSPEIEYHHPECPKWTSGGVKACRCGAAPMEAIFEDDLKKKP